MAGDLPTIPREALTADGDGLVYELADYNAPRPCTTCQEGSDYYVYYPGLLSVFLCAQHFREAPTKPAEELGV